MQLYKQFGVEVIYLSLSHVVNVAPFKPYIFLMMSTKHVIHFTSGT